MVQDALGTAYATAWQDVRFYSGAVGDGSTVDGGNTYICFNYVNTTSSAKPIYLTLRAGSAGDMTVLIEDQLLWLRSS